MHRFLPRRNRGTRLRLRRSRIVVLGLLLLLTHTALAIPRSRTLLPLLSVRLRLRTMRTETRCRRFNHMHHNAGTGREALHLSIGGDEVVDRDLYVCLMGFLLRGHRRHVCTIRNLDYNVVQ